MSSEKNNIGGAGHLSSSQISIIMPAYNSGDYIASSIQSVQQQTFQDWELIVIDNGSTDNTSKIVETFMQKDLRIVLLTENHFQSVALARKRGIQSAHSKWIAFMDSDDLWASQKLKTQMEFAKKYNSRFLFTSSGFVTDDGMQMDYIFHVPGEIGYPAILKQNVISCSSVLIEKELLTDCFNETSNELCDDFAAWIRVLRDYRLNALGIDLPLLIYRLRDRSLSRNKIQSAMAAYRTYRHTDHSVPVTLRYWIVYIFRSLAKYCGIYTK